MSDLMIVFGVLCAVASLGLSLYDYLERRVNHERPEETQDEE